MRLINISDNDIIVVDFVEDFGDKEIEDANHDEILRTVEAGKNIIFADNNKLNILANNNNFLDLLRNDNITASPQILENIEQQNFNKLTKKFIKNNLMQISGNNNDNNERKCALLNRIKEDYNISDVKPHKDKAEVRVNGKKQIASIEYGTAGDGKLKLNIEVVLNFNNEENYALSTLGYDTEFKTWDYGVKPCPIDRPPHKGLLPEKFLNSLKGFKDSVYKCPPNLDALTKVVEKALQPHITILNITVDENNYVYTLGDGTEHKIYLDIITDKELN